MRKPVILILVGVLVVCLLILAIVPLCCRDSGEEPTPTPPPTEPSSPTPEPPGAEIEEEPEPTPPPEVELDNVPEGAVFDPETQTFSWQTQPGDAGIYLNVCFRVTDPYGAYDEECINIIVFSSNEAPSLSPVPIQVVDVGSVVTFTLQASDPDEDELEFFARNLPPGSIWNPPVFSWAPTEAGIWPGLVFGVSDGEEKVTRQVIIAVK